MDALSIVSLCNNLYEGYSVSGVSVEGEGGGLFVDVVGVAVVGCQDAPVFQVCNELFDGVSDFVNLASALLA